MQSKTETLSLCPCAAEEELECLDTEGPVVCWEGLVLPDLDCDEKPVWISSSSLAGELIQPGPQEVWGVLRARADCCTAWRLQTKQARWPSDRRRTEFHWGSRRSSGGRVRDTACYGEEDAKGWMDWADMSNVGGGKKSKCERRSDVRRRQRAKKGGVAQKQKLYPTGAKTLIKDQKLFRWLIYFL